MPAEYVTAAMMAAAFAIAAIGARLSHIVVHRLVGAEEIAPGRREAVRARALKLTRTLTLLLYGIAGMVSLTYVLPRLGLAELLWEPRDIGRWIVTHGINIVLIVIGAAVIMRAANLAIEFLQGRLDRRRVQADLEWQRRASTLRGILTNVVTVSVGFVAALMLLRELSIDIMPIVTTAGIAGLAIGFGAQNLVRDVISGFFVILEDQVRVGDLARINGVMGIIEEINLRTIVLRDGDGAVHVFPSGTISALANLSKQFSFAVVDVKVAFGESLDRVIGTIREIGEAMERDHVWGALVLEPIEILGIESIEGGVATIRVRFKTQPLNQGKVASELRRRVLTTLAARGVRPYAGS